MSATISHWINNASYAGDSTDSAPVTNPATGEVTGRVALASVEDARAVIDAAVAAFPTGGTPRWLSAPRSFSSSVNCSTSARASWPRSSLLSTARWSLMLWARSAAAKRWSSSRAVSLICSRAGSPRTPRRRSTCTRSVSRWDRSGSSARSISRPWCRCGFSPSRSPPVTPWCSNPRRRTPRRRCGWRRCGLRPVCRRGCSTCCKAIRPRSTNC